MKFAQITAVLAFSSLMCKPTDATMSPESSALPCNKFGITMQNPLTGLNLNNLTVTEKFVQSLFYDVSPTPPGVKSLRLRIEEGGWRLTVRTKRGQAHKYHYSPGDNVTFSDLC